MWLMHSYLRPDPLPRIPPRLRSHAVRTVLWVRTRTLLAFPLAASCFLPPTPISHSAFLPSPLRDPHSSLDPQSPRRHHRLTRANHHRAIGRHALIG